ncbi:MAG: hypothetical protein E7517_04315 [Ruminococcaceae bacterium]|nr:hypothetical protein [Oscillospiraceae bacterium]
MLFSGDIMKKNKWLGALTVPIEQADLPHFELNGSKQFLADGCRGILHFDESKVCLNCGSEVVEVEGCSLSLHHMGEDEAEVTGSIRSVKFK